MRPVTAAIGEHWLNTLPSRHGENRCDQHNALVPVLCVPAVLWSLRRMLRRTRTLRVIVAVALRQIHYFRQLPPLGPSALYASEIVPLRRSALPSSTILAIAASVLARAWAGHRTEQEKPSFFFDDLGFLLIAPRHVLGFCSGVFADVTDERFRRRITATAALMPPAAARAQRS